MALTKATLINLNANELILDLDALQVKRQAVKDKYPKP